MKTAEAAHSREHTVFNKLMVIWRKHKNTILLVVILLMALYTALSLGKQIWRLLWDTGGVLGAVDLMARYGEVHAFFSGKSVLAPYPPPSYAIMWPLLGWVPENIVRYVWALFYVLTFMWLFCLLSRESRADSKTEIVFICMCLLSMNAAHATVGVGQLGLLVIALLISSITLINNNKDGNVYRDIAGSLLFLAALVKPTISAPFFWIILFTGRLRPAVLVAAGYVALYLFSASFQDAGFIELTQNWLKQGTYLAEHPEKGSLNANYLFTYSEQVLQLEQSKAATKVMPHISIEVALIFLIILGFWIYYYRHIDAWVLLGATGIFARLWTYHHTYDDVVMLLPMVAFFRIAKDLVYPDTVKITASTLLFATVIINFFPAYVLKAWPQPWPFVYIFTHIAVWAGSVVFLQFMAQKQKNLAKNTGNYSMM